MTGPVPSSSNPAARSRARRSSGVSDGQTVQMNGRPSPAIAAMTSAILASVGLGS